MRFFAALTVAALLSLCGCTPKPGPAVSLVTVRLTDVTALETTAVFTLRFSNDQPEPMTLNGGAHEIYINGLYVGEGLSDAELTLPRLGTATQEVTVHMNNIALATRIKPIVESESFEYQIHSTLYGKSPAGKMRSESKGRLDLKDFTPPETDASTNNTGAVTNQEN